MCQEPLQIRIQYRVQIQCYWLCKTQHGHRTTFRKMIGRAHVREEELNSTTEKFTTSTDMLGIAWEYSFQDKGSPGQLGLQYESSHDITTILAGNEGNETRIDAGQRISLTMARLFEMAGFSNLDSVSPNSGQMGASSTHAEPSKRLTGIQLDLLAQCQPQYSFWNFLSLRSKVKSPPLQSFLRSTPK